MKLSIARCFATLVVALLLTSFAIGDEACFSPDGNSVYLLGHNESGEVRRIDIYTGESAILSFEGVESDDPVTALGRGEGDTLLLANSTGIWESGPDGGATRLVVRLESFFVRGIVMTPAKAKAAEKMIIVSGMSVGENSGMSGQTRMARH